MARLSINNVHADMPLAQIKTGEIFTIQMIDLVAKKVTISDGSGEEKVISKATLERWYRELTEDELQQKFSESEATEQTEESTDADANDNATEVEEQSNTIEDETQLKTEEPTDNGTETAEVHENLEKESEEANGQPDENNINNDGNGAKHGESNQGNSDDGVASPVTPSNAGKDKDKSKEQKKQEPKNAALMKVRQTIIDTILADSPSIQLKKTTSYDVLKEKHNFAEITHGSNRFNVSVMSKCLTEDQLNKVKVNPASFGWSIDADFTVFDEGDIETAVQLIRQSREYRLANPVTRKKKEKK